MLKKIIYGLLSITFVAILLLYATSHRYHPDHAAPLPLDSWWLGQVNVSTWATVFQGQDQDYIPFLKAMGAGVADRGVYCGGLRRKHVAACDGGDGQLKQSLGQAPLKVTAFYSAEYWPALQPWVGVMTRELRGFVDAGFDGVHIDWMGTPAFPCCSLGAIQAMRDSTKRYGRDKYGKNIMFTGNVWQLENKLALEAAKISDVTWIESWGLSDLELVRISRVGASLDPGRKPVWYHLQPQTDDVAIVQEKHNIFKALYSACLFEGAVFMVNYKYPVLISKTGEWKMFYVGQPWLKDAVIFSRFARQYKKYFFEGRHISRNLVAYRPDQAWAANAMMDELLRRGLDFNVMVYGDAPFQKLEQASLEPYRRIYSTEALGLPETPDRTYSVGAGDPSLAHVNDLVEVRGAEKVLYRVNKVGNETAVIFKRMGYELSSDSIPKSGEFEVVYRGSAFAKAYLIHPEKEGRQSLSVRVENGFSVWTMPAFEYLAAVILKNQEKEPGGRSVAQTVRVALRRWRWGRAGLYRDL